MERSPTTSRSLDFYYHINGDTFEKQYKEVLSGYREWKDREHAAEWLVFPENTGPRLCIDETSISDGELYTIVSNPDARGKKGSLVAIINGVKSEHIINILRRKIPFSKRLKVNEITLDMSNSMGKIARCCFPKAIRTIDRFHIQQMAFDAVQELRIAHRWEAIRQEADDMKKARFCREAYSPFIFSNGDSLRQLLVRSRYLLFKSPEKWTQRQKERAEILFDQYPDLQEAYSLSHSLRMIFSRNTHKDAARLSLAKWYDRADRSGFKSFQAIISTLTEHHDGVLNFFVNRSTNAFAECFNAKIKQFRALLRGVIDIPFFLFRLTKIYA